MENKSFMKTKEGGLSIAFIIIIVAFIVEEIGLMTDIKSIYSVGFIAILAAIMYSPIGVYILKKW